MIEAFVENPQNEYHPCWMNDLIYIHLSSLDTKLRSHQIFSTQGKLTCMNSHENRANFMRILRMKKRRKTIGRRKHTIFMRNLHDFMRYLYDYHV